jgi:hypothetical protein
MALIVPEKSRPKASGNVDCLYWPARTFQSAPLTLAATTSMTTSPGPAAGSGKSPYFKTSGPPYCSMKAAFMMFLPLRSGADPSITRWNAGRMVHRACNQAMAASLKVLALEHL